MQGPRPIMARVQHEWDPAVDKADQGGVKPPQTGCQSLAPDIASYATPIGQLVLLLCWKLGIVLYVKLEIVLYVERPADARGRVWPVIAQVNLPIKIHWSISSSMDNYYLWKSTHLLHQFVEAIQNFVQGY